MYRHHESEKSDLVVLVLVSPRIECKYLPFTITSRSQAVLLLCGKVINETGFVFIGHTAPNTPGVYEYACVCVCVCVFVANLRR